FIIVVFVKAPALSCLLPLVTFWRRRFSGLPPGPAPPSWVGNMLKVDVADLPRSLPTSTGPSTPSTWASRPCIVLSGFQVLKEALVDRAEEFGGRGDSPAAQTWIIKRGGGKGGAGQPGLTGPGRPFD
uniref:Uncharacterized protein n=1 Tax=Ornithorhynchus anatinus TaxID=9258 RepID=A0A6I8N4B4_ORNAN